MHRAFESQILPRLAEAVATEHRTELKNRQKEEQQIYEKKLERKKLQYQQRKDDVRALSKFSNTKEKELKQTSSNYCTDTEDVMEFCTAILDLKQNQTKNCLDKMKNSAMISMEQFVDSVEVDIEEYKKSRLFQLQNMFDPFLLQGKDPNKTKTTKKTTTTKTAEKNEVNSKMDKKSGRKESLALSIANAQTVEEAEDLLFLSDSPQQSSSSSSFVAAAAVGATAAAAAALPITAAALPVVAGAAAAVAVGRYLADDDKNKIDRQPASDSNKKDLTCSVPSSKQNDKNKNNSNNSNNSNRDDKNNTQTNILGKSISKLQSIRDQLDKKANETPLLIRKEYQNEFPKELIHSCSKT